MAKVSGIQCDMCNKLHTDPNGKPPTGWVQLIPVVDVATTDGDHFDLCSAACLLDLAAMRYDAENGDGTAVKEFTRRQQRVWRQLQKEAKAAEVDANT